MKTKATIINNSEKVKAFYDLNTEKFLAVYGEIIQAFRTINVADYLDYTIKSARIKPGEHILDAGCGVCGPAIYFAQHVPEIKIEACTISSVQHNMALNSIKQTNTTGLISVWQQDYHLLSQKFSANTFDMVYFLESFGHSNQKNQLIDECWEVLKPGGRIYIKDLFKRISDDEWEQLRINELCDDINKAYEYEIGALDLVITKLRSKGFELSFVKTPEIELDKFEHLSISNDFQNLFNIAKIDSWDNYIFPIDFYEIMAIKPKPLNPAEMHLYFMNKREK